MSDMDMTRNEKWKQWRLANKEKWSQYCKERHANNMKNPEYRERMKTYAKKAYEKQIETDPDKYREKMRENVKNHYYKNHEDQKIKKLARYYFNKIKKNNHKYDNIEEMLIDECKGLKDDNCFYYIADYVADNYDKFIEIKEADNIDDENQGSGNPIC